MIDFPNSPTTGQIVTAPNGTAWRWSGSAWLLGSAASAAGARGMVAYKDIQANQTGIAAAETNIAGLSASWNASPDRIYRIRSYMEIGGVAGDVPLVYVRESPSNVIWGRMATPIVNGGISEQFYTEYITGGLSGPRTVKATAQRVLGSGGTLTITANPSFPAFIMVEDITYDGGMTGPYPEAPAIAASISTASQAYSANVWTMASLTVKNWDNTGGFTLSGGKVIVPKAGVYEASLKVVQTVANAPQVVLAWGANYGSSDTWFLDDSLAKDTHRVTGPLMTQAAAGGALEFWVYSRTVASTILITANIKRVAGAPA